MPTPLEIKPSNFRNESCPYTISEVKDKNVVQLRCWTRNYETQPFDLSLNPKIQHGDRSIPIMMN